MKQKKSSKKQLWNPQRNRLTPFFCRVQTHSEGCSLVFNSLKHWRSQVSLKTVRGKDLFPFQLELDSLLWLTSVAIMFSLHTCDSFIVCIYFICSVMLLFDNFLSEVAYTLGVTKAGHTHSFSGKVQEHFFAFPVSRDLKLKARVPPFIILYFK